MRAEYTGGPSLRSRKGSFADTGGMQLFEDDAYQAMGRILGPAVRTVVDAGAHRGAVSRRLAEVFPHARVYAFEPVDEVYAELKLAASERPTIVPVRAALADREGEAELNVNGCPGTSSLLAASERCLAYHADKVRTVRRERVPLVRLDHWALREHIRAVDVIKIDVQGAELDVLRGASGLMQTLRAVYSEAQLTPLYDGAATFTDLDLFLRDQGFVLHRIQEIFSNGPERQTTCCDGLWLKREELAQYVRRVAAAA